MEKVGIPRTAAAMTTRHSERYRGCRTHHVRRSLRCRCRSGTLKRLTSAVANLAYLLHLLPPPPRRYILVTITLKTTTTSESAPMYASTLSSAHNLLFSPRNQPRRRLGHLRTHLHANRRTKGLWYESGVVCRTRQPEQPVDCFRVKVGSSCTMRTVAI